MGPAAAFAAHPPPAAFFQQLSTMQIKMMLEENKRLLLAGFEELNSNDNVGKTVGLLEHIHCNLMYLSTAADFQANSRYVLRENRELIAKEDLEEF